MKYEVRIPEIHYSYRFVEAESPEQAKHLALFGKNKNEMKAEFFKTLEEGIEVIELKGDK
jgi:hypothetical protein